MKILIEQFSFHGMCEFDFRYSYNCVLLFRSEFVLRSVYIVVELFFESFTADKFFIVLL